MRTPKDSFTSMTQLIMPNDTNPLGNLMGGNLLSWMDVASGITAMKHCSSHVVTAAVDSVSFKEPIRLGDIVTIEAVVTRAFNTSMEIKLSVFKQAYDSDRRTKCNEAYYTFVALDANGKPKHTPSLQPETAGEKELYESAKRRRDLRLVLAGRLKPEDAKELKMMFLGQEEV